MRRILALCWAVSLGSSSAGCIPYAVGTTAQTIEPGRVVPSMSMYFIPGGIESLSDPAARETAGYAAADLEARIGLDERSDLGVRIPAASGVVVNYKRRLGGVAPGEGPAVALLAGAGVVNLGAHAHTELTVVASARSGAMLTPYGGARGMQVFPLVPGAVHDSPTLGAFLGARIGRADLGVSPELAFYYDRSVLELRERSFIVVPSFTVHGAQLLRVLTVLR